MPSPMSALHDDSPPLTNDEIETLYDIVRYAQTLPGTPTAALFDAYDHVRTQKYEQDASSRLFTFLIRMQEERGHEEEGLIGKFQRALAKLDIQVEIDPEGEGVEVTENLHNAPRTAQPRGREVFGRIRSRRGSFDSFFEGTADKVAGVEYGQDVPLRPRRGSVAASDGGDRRVSRRSRSDSAARAHPLPIRERVNGYGHQRGASGNMAAHPRRTGSVSSRGSLRIHRDGLTDTRQFGYYEGDDSEHTTESFDRSNIQIPGVNVPLPERVSHHEELHPVPVALYRPSDTQVVRDAETFAYHRDLALARRTIRNWQDRVRENVTKREDMEASAIAFDRNVLLRASLDSWRVALQAKRQAVETDRFFERLEKRAEKARNLFLLTKAFTHWAKSAEDEVQRTSTARRHILRTKYFNAWRDITAVNELKIQHFVLRRFLDKWRNRTAKVLKQNDMAVTLYEHNLVYRLYWQWFWRFGERRAPILHVTRQKRETIRKWAEIVGILKEREAWAVQHRNRELARRTISKLGEKAATIQRQHAEADEFSKSASLSLAFYALRKRAQHEPLLARFSTKVDARLVRSTFTTWQRNAQIAHQARDVDRLRLLRNGFTAWNDRLRIKAVEDQINDRLQLQCLYKWALASRLSLFQRVHDHRLKRSALTTWMSKTQRQELTLEDAEQRFADFKRRQLLRSAVQRLENATIERRNQEELVRSVYEPRLLQRVFDKLVQKHEQLQELDNWAERANYYVTTNNAIKRWQRATEYARRNRRREAYAQMRRTVKMNLVRRTFNAWKDRSAQLVITDRQANEIVENRVLRTSTQILAQWRDRTVVIRTQTAQAVRISNTKVATSALSRWSRKYQDVEDLEGKAIALRQESTELAASSCLKKLGWRVFNLQRLEENALALHQRNFEKHLRAMIRFWWDQTSERVAQRPVSPTPSSRRRGPPSSHDEEDDEAEGGDADGDDQEGDGNVGGAQSVDEAGDETRRLEGWTAFDENALGLGNTNLDLSFTVSPHRRTVHLPARPYTQPPPSSALRPPPSLRRPFAPTIQEVPDLEMEDDPEFWTSTPAPMLRPGYLKTPSKRSVARAKRPELPASPEKRTVAGSMAGTSEVARIGAMSAPPVPGYIDRGSTSGLGRGVTSFERRLRDGGFGSSVGQDPGAKSRGRVRGRVAFGDLYEH